LKAAHWHRALTSKTKIILNIMERRGRWSVQNDQTGSLVIKTKFR
jgi:hypothetical protein